MGPLSRERLVLIQGFLGGGGWVSLDVSLSWLPSVATVPRPVIVNTSSIGSRNGLSTFRFGIGTHSLYLESRSRTSFWNRVQLRRRYADFLTETVDTMEKCGFPSYFSTSTAR